MEQREKLIELLKKSFVNLSDFQAEVASNMLLANGVVVLPCRCKDCKHLGDEEFAEGGYRVCGCEAKDYATNEPSGKYCYFPVTVADDFCSYGELKERFHR